MKVGTDGVLLGAWATVAPHAARILDIGTGTGVIALMLAQRAPRARITGIDIGDVAEARANADASPWADRVEMIRCPVQEFRPAERFDLIVSNPPYFVDSLRSPDAGRNSSAWCFPWPRRRFSMPCAAGCGPCAAPRCAPRPGAACAACSPSTLPCRPPHPGPTRSRSAPERTRSSRRSTAR